MDDWQLLDDYLTRKSEGAFRTLVSRYINLVRATALRGVRDVALADEVTQAVFILLARKAARLHSSKNLVLGGWLHRTTRFVAARAVRGEERRRRREQEAFNMQQISSADDAWRQVAPLLDEGIEKLDAPGRAAIILRYIQGEPLRKVGESLGISEEAARKRVDRSIDKLRGFFSRRGFTISAAALGSALAAHKSEAASPEFAAAVGAKALAQAASGMAVVPPLVIETLQAWHWAAVKMIGGISFALVVAALLATVGWKSLVRPAENSGRATNVPDRVAAASSAVMNGSRVKSESAGAMLWQFQIQALDAVTSKPIANAKVMVVSCKDVKHIDHQNNLHTDAEGRCDIGLPYANPALLFVGVLADGYEERCIVEGVEKPLASPYTMHLPPGSTIGGTVMDKLGHPVADAHVHVSFYGTGDSSNREFQQERPGFPDDDQITAAATTDGAGRWTFRSAPTNADFWVQVTHPDFPEKRFENDQDERSINGGEQVKLEDLRAGKAVLILDSGLNLSGVVTDEYGYALKQAQVRFGEFFSDGPVSVEADGSFTLHALPGGANHVTITADGFAPQRIAVQVTTNMPPLAVKLKPAGILKVRVVDEAGNPLPGAWLGIEGWLGPNTLEWRGTADRQGRIVWNSAPLEPVTFSVLKDGYIVSRSDTLTADGDEHTFVLHPQVVISGFVTDAETKRPIASFKAIPGSMRNGTTYGSNGQYTLPVSEIESPEVVHIEAAGYEPVGSEPLDIRRTNQILNFQLKRLGAGNSIEGVVLLPDGSPAAGAQVTLRAGIVPIDLGRKKLMEPENRTIIETDAQGHFSLPTGAGGRAVVAVHEAGTGTVALKNVAGSVTIQLRPWGRIEGVLKVRSRPVAGQGILLFTRAQPNSDDVFQLNHTTMTDGGGNFTFDKCPPGNFSIYLMGAGGTGQCSHQTHVEVQAGATSHVQIGGTGGAIISGKFVLTGPGETFDWSQCLFDSDLQTRLPYPPGLSGRERTKWYREFSQSEEGKAALRQLTDYTLDIQPNGSFTIEDVPPGGYELRAQVCDSPVDVSRRIFSNPIGSIRQDVDVPPMSEGQSDEKIDLGEVALHPLNR